MRNMNRLANQINDHLANQPAAPGTVADQVYMDYVQARRTMVENLHLAYLADARAATAEQMPAVRARRAELDALLPSLWR